MALRKNRKAELLRSVPLFSECSKRELGDVAELADELSVPAGTALMREGERGREFVVLVEGTVKVTRKGRKVAELGDGDFVGEIALVADVPRTATVVASSPLRMLVVSDRAFQRLLRQQPALAAKVMRSLGERLAAMSAGS
ncbi:MAG: cyclic nucleotide-binding domain-containing protein [Thermoleophilia bacterium]|nr:cyclic nucleotide-binding domain-containing protein [Thermoleophilia bacterium]MDH5332321.1 cyclic nucleotide-binding domain-containing protein [Thermoleophilia bacterium]